MKRIAFYGGSFDPVHRGHMAITESLLSEFELDRFVFIPAFHAPHKVRLKPTSAYDRYAMLCLATQHARATEVSRIEIEAPERPFSVETLGSLNQGFPDDELFFVMGADSWMDIRTWREWEKVLSMSNHIVVTRPGIDIRFDHVTDSIRARIRDQRQTRSETDPGRTASSSTSSFANGPGIYVTDSVQLDISATEVRRKVREEDPLWREDVTPEVAKYIEKYQIYN